MSIIDTSVGVMYIFNPQTNQFIPYKPDFSAGIPVSDFNLIQQERANRESRTPKRNNELGIIVPLITQQPRQADWAQIASIAQRYPRVNTVAIVSPSQDTRGIEEFGPDAAFNNGIRFLQNASVIVLGYLSATEGKLVDNVKLEMDRWRDWYPSVNGLFFDSIPSSSPPGEIEDLAAYAKVDKGFRYVFANLAGALPGGAVNRTDDFVDKIKGVDTFIIYEREQYIADSWYANLKKDWMGKYPRSKFAVVVYRVGPETFALRNFIDKCVGIERLAGYVYVHTSYADDRRKMREWPTISPLTEVCIDSLSALAVTESIPASRGVVPEKSKVDTQDVGMQGGKGDTTPETTPQSIQRQDIEVDKFGVRKIYPSATGGKGVNEWYLFEDNPAADSSFKNLPDQLIREPDGLSWSTKDDAVRLEAWSPKDRKFRNVEITGYFKPLTLPEGQRYAVQQYARGGHHYKDIKKWGEGSAYKGRLLANGAVCVVKEIHHNAYTANRGVTQATTKPLHNRWIGFKTIIHNYVVRNSRTRDDSTFVGLEIWIDDNVNDENGKLVVRNDWKQVMVMQDEGGWGATATYSTKTGKGFRANKYPRLDVNNKNSGSKSERTYRQRDEIITNAGGSEDQNCVAWRWDECRVAFTHLSVREIQKVQPD